MSIVEAKFESTWLIEPHGRLIYSFYFFFCPKSSMNQFANYLFKNFGELVFFFAIPSTYNMVFKILKA